MRTGNNVESLVSTGNCAWGCSCCEHITREIEKDVNKDERDRFRMTVLMDIEDISSLWTYGMKFKFACLHRCYSRLNDSFA